MTIREDLKTSKFRPAYMNIDDVLNTCETALIARTPEGLVYHKTKNPGELASDIAAQNYELRHKGKVSGATVSAQRFHGELEEGAQYFRLDLPAHPSKTGFSYVVVVPKGNQPIVQKLNSYTDFLINMCNQESLGVKDFPGNIAPARSVRLGHFDVSAVLNPSKHDYLLTLFDQEADEGLLYDMFEMGLVPTRYIDLALEDPVELTRRENAFVNQNETGKKYKFSDLKANAKFANFVNARLLIEQVYFEGERGSLSEVVGPEYIFANDRIHTILEYPPAYELTVDQLVEAREATRKDNPTDEVYKQFTAQREKKEGIRSISENISHLQVLLQQLGMKGEANLSGYVALRYGDDTGMLVERSLYAVSNTINEQIPQTHEADLVIYRNKR